MTLTSPRKRHSPTKSTLHQLEKSESIQITVNITNSNIKKTPKFIKLIGRGPQPSQEVEPGVILTPSHNNGPRKPSSPNEIIDVIDGDDTEDPFTLEPFNSLIEMHLEKGKDFILARVTTADAQDENRFYYSYYPAHQINKILFRTQLDLGLLHRMKAKNPLNNMPIVGDVHYYIIRRAESPQVVATPNAEDPLIPKGASQFWGGFQSDSNHTVVVMRNDDSTEAKAKTSKMTPIESFRRPSRKLYETVIFPSSRRNSADEVYSDPPTPQIIGTIRTPFNHSEMPPLSWNKSVEEESLFRKVRSISYQNDCGSASDLTDWIKKHAKIHQAKSISKLSKLQSLVSTDHLESPVIKEDSFWEARYLASDDDFLMQSAIRSLFKKNALENSDGVLFSISSNQYRHAQPPEGSSPHPVLSQYVITFIDRNGNMTGITTKGLRIGLLVLTLVGIILIKVLVPADFIFLCIFLLLLIDILILLIFV